MDVFTDKDAFKAHGLYFSEDDASSDTDDTNFREEDYILFMKKYSPLPILIPKDKLVVITPKNNSLQNEWTGSASKLKKNITSNCSWIDAEGKGDKIFESDIQRYIEMNVPNKKCELDVENIQPDASEETGSKQKITRRKEKTEQDNNFLFITVGVLIGSYAVIRLLKSY